MSAQPNYEELTFSTEETLVKQTEVECKLNAAGEIKSVLAVTGTASPIGEEAVGEEIRYSGRAVFSVLYETADGALAKAECGVEFTDKADRPENATAVRYISFTVQAAEARSFGGGYSVQAVVQAEISVRKERSVRVCTGGERILCDCREAERTCPVGSDRGTVQVDEEFELNYFVKDVLAHSVSCTITEAQSGVGAIVLDGFVFLSMTVLQNTEKGDIIKEQKTIPFRAELALGAASPAMRAFARARVAKSAFKVIVDEEKNVSTVVASFDLDAFGCVFETRSFRVVRDAYSVTNEVTPAFCSAKQTYISAQYVTSEKVSGTTDYEADDRTDVVTVLGERVENVRVNRETNTLIGLISACVVTRGEEGYSGRRVVLPFEAPFGGAADGTYKITPSIETLRYRTRAGLEFDAVVKFAVTEMRTAEYELLTDLAVGEEKSPKTNAISVYLARGNDTLWDVCKELGVDADVIAELNPDVEFPLRGNERIVIYRSI